MPAYMMMSQTVNQSQARAAAGILVLSLHGGRQTEDVNLRDVKNK